MPINTHQRRRHGFSLLEILIVIAFIGIITATVSISLLGRADQAKIDTAYIRMDLIKNSLEAYKIRNGAFPSTVEGLGPLVVGNYLNQSDLLDPWSVEYAFYSPVQDALQGFDLRSNGPDKQAGTQDDLSIWDPRP